MSGDIFLENKTKNTVLAAYNAAYGRYFNCMQKIIDLN